MDEDQNEISTASAGDTVYISLWNENETITGVSYEGITFTPVEGANNTWSFTMPDKDVSITIVYESSTPSTGSHTITVTANTDHPNTTVLFFTDENQTEAPSSIPSGTTIYAYVSLADGDNGSVNGLICSDASVVFTKVTTGSYAGFLVWSFTMPNSDITLSVNYGTAAASHSLSFKADANHSENSVMFMKSIEDAGSMTGQGLTTATTGEEILVYVVIADEASYNGVVADGVTFTPDATYPTMVFHFIMPDNDVEVAIDYVTTPASTSHSLSYDASSVAPDTSIYFLKSMETSGTLVSETSAEEGETIYFVVSAGDVSNLESVTSDVEGLILTEDTQNSSQYMAVYSFTMPSSDVTMTLHYASATSYNLTAAADSNHSETMVTFGTDSTNIAGTAITNADVGDIVYVKVELSSSDESVYDISLASNVDSLTFTKSNSTDNIWSFTMPSSDLAISVTYEGKSYSLVYEAESDHPNTEVTFYSSSDLLEDHKITSAKAGDKVYVKGTFSQTDIDYGDPELYGVTILTTKESDGVWSFTMTSSPVYILVDYHSVLGTYTGDNSADILILNSDGTGSWKGDAITFTYNKTTKGGTFGGDLWTGTYQPYTSRSLYLNLTHKTDSSKRFYGQVTKN